MNKSELISIFGNYEPEGIKLFITTGDRKNVNYLPENIVDAIEKDITLQDDLFWYLEIREEVRLEEFACVHLAYASSEKLNKVITKRNNVYEIRIDEAEGIGVVIGNCPWCGINLNVS